MLPRALVIGCTAKEFWYEDPSLLNAFSKAYELKVKDGLEEWKMKTNFIAWINGAYIQSAIASVLSKDAKYPRNPLSLFDESNTEKQMIKENEDAIRKRSKQIDILLNKKNKL